MESEGIRERALFLLWTEPIKEAFTKKIWHLGGCLMIGESEKVEARDNASFYTQGHTTVFWVKQLISLFVVVHRLSSCVCNNKKLLWETSHFFFFFFFFFDNKDALLQNWILSNFGILRMVMYKTILTHVDKDNWLGW